MTEGDKKFWKTAMKHADVQVERDSDAFHTSSRGSFTSSATMEEMRYEIKWLNALFAQVCSRSTHTAGVRASIVALALHHSAQYSCRARSDDAIAWN
jgi:hypothetical protein